MIYLTGSTKGGAGKTTTGVNLAAELACSGRDVLVVDGDRQGTALTAISLRLAAERVPGIAVAQYVDGKALRGQVLQQRDKYDDIVIDAGGHDSTALRAALMLCDVLVMPFQPRSFDVWALEDMSNLLSEARAVREDSFPAYAFLNMADPDSRSTDNADAAAAVADWPELQLLDVSLYRRKAFANAASLGLSVTEMRPRDRKACDELRALIAAVS